MSEQIEEIQVRRSWEELVSEGMNAREEMDGGSWKLGDLALEVETAYGDDTIGKYAYAVGKEKKTMMNYRTVSERFSGPIREKYKKLSFSHFATLVATEKPEAWLEKADNEEWSVEMLRKNVHKAYPSLTEPDLSGEPPEVYKCPECHQWRLKDTSSFEICRGHYKIGKKGMVYQ